METLMKERTERMKEKRGYGRKEDRKYGLGKETFDMAVHTGGGA